MAIWDIFKTAVAEKQARGRITDLTVEQHGDGERWRFRLDSQPDEEFVFEPTPLSPIRRQGEQVSITYNGPVDGGRAHTVEQISST